MPRTENKIKYLQVAYHHVPYMAYGVFAKSLASKYIDKDTIIPSLLNPRNPAGIINVLRTIIMITVLFMYSRHDDGYAW